jgi:hypothetical protein
MRLVRVGAVAIVVAVAAGLVSGCASKSTEALPEVLQGTWETDAPVVFFVFEDGAFLLCITQDQLAQNQCDESSYELRNVSPDGQSADLTLDVDRFGVQVVNQDQLELTDSSGQTSRLTRSDT